MARFAPTCPPQILEGLRDARILGSYHLLLAHDVIKRPAEYADIFNSKMMHQCIIMDNSIVELGSATSLGAVVEAAKTVRADVVVLPDVYGEGPETFKSIQSSFGTWHSALQTCTNRLGNPIQYMLVPQGRDLEEWIHCCEALADLFGAVDKHLFNVEFWWGIPRLFQERFGLSRQIGANIAHMLQPDWHIHLLGFSNDICDDIITARLPFVTGIDSAVPMRAASLKQDFSLALKIPPRGDWWETCTYNSLMERNVKKVQQLLA